MQFTSLIFDFGGVLIDWNPRNLYRRYFEDPEKMEQFLRQVDFAGWNLLQDQGRPFAEGVAELSSRFPQHTRLIRAYWDRWEDSVGEPIQGTVALVTELKQCGYSVYGLSNWSAETFPRIRHKIGFLDLLDGYLLSGEVGLIKPDPAIFHLALRRFGRNPQECIFIDDSPVNIQAATGQGIFSILFESPIGLRRKLQEIQILWAHHAA